MRSSLSRTVRTLRVAAAGLIAASVPLASMACGSGTTSAGASGTSSQAPVSVSARIGTNCGMFSPTGFTGTHAVTADKALAAAARSPQLSLLASAAAKAGLTRALDSMHAFTLFAPSNAAFMRVLMSADGLMHNKLALLRILRYHVVGTRINPVQMAHGAIVPTLEGSQLKFSLKGSAFVVNGANVLCGNIQTKNATIYIIDKVLIPPK